MELQFITDRVACLESVFVREMSREDTFEFTLPDLMPDMSAVLTAAGTALLRSKDPVPGCCEIAGTVENSVIFRGVKISKGAVVKNSIIMQGSYIGKDASVNCVIADKNVIIKDGRVLSGHETMPFFIGKGRMV